MRILIVNRYMSIYGGAENVVKELATHLTRRGIDNLVVTLNISDQVRDSSPEVRFQTPNEEFGYELRSVGLRQAAGIWREIAALRALVHTHAQDYDLINTHNFPANVAAYGAGKPVVWMCNEPPDLWNNPNPSLPMRAFRETGVLLDKLVVRKVDRICVADELNRSRVEQRYRRSTTIVPYGIDCELFTDVASDRTGLAARYGFDADDFILLQAGVVSPQKNQIESVDALRSLVAEGHKATLLLVGDNDTPYRRMLDEHIARHGVTERVIYTGRVDKPVLAGMYASADVGLFPVKAQGGWLAPFEALLCRTPVIVSATMGASSLIQRHDLGLATDDFSTGILRLKDGYDTFLDKAVLAAGWIRENLTWARYTDDLVRVYEETLRERRQS